MLGNWLSSVRYDLRLTARQLAKARGFTTVAVLTLALGIGANTAIFSVVHHLLLAPLPYPDGNSIVQLMRTPGGGKMSFGTDARLFEAWRARSHSLEGFAAEAERRLPMGDANSADSVLGARVTPGFLGFLSVRPLKGREFVAADSARGAAPVAMISAGLWRRVYGGRVDVIGQSIRVNGSPYAIVGVAPDGLVIPMEGDLPRELLLPLSMDTAEGTFVALARLRPDVAQDAASKELVAIMRTLPDTAAYNRFGARAMRSQDYLGNKQVRTISILFAAVCALLLIACVNVANLLLARGWSRRRELALRVALGAGRGRLVRQVLGESVLLALVGGMLGLAIAWVGLHTIIAMRPRYLDDLATVRIEPAVLMWSFAISMVSGLLFGAGPALLAAARSPGDVLRSGARASSGGATANRLRGALVVAEVALSLVMLVGAGLLARSFVHLVDAPLGFDATGMFHLSLIPNRGVNLEVAYAQQRDVARELRGLPGIAGVQFGSMPSRGYFVAEPPEVDGRAGPEKSDVKSLSVTSVSPGYFRFAGIPLITGRGFDSTGASGGGLEAVIGQGLARRLWPGGNAIGHRVRLTPRDPWLTVIGVVGDVHYPTQIGDYYAMQVYTLPDAASGPGGLLIRTRDSTLAWHAVQRAVAVVGPVLQPRNFSSPAELIEYNLAPARFAMALIGVFALVALVLTAVGLYGVVAYSVSHRTREIGVRVALGAQPASVARLVMGEGLRLTAVGLVLGLGAAAVATRALTTMLFGVSALDPLTFGSIAALLVVVTLVAAYVPTRRALKIDPTEALRAE